MSVPHPKAIAPGRVTLLVLLPFFRFQDIPHYFHGYAFHGSFLRDLGEGREREGSGMEVGFGGWEVVVQGFLKNRKEGMQNSAVLSVNGIVKGSYVKGKKNLQSLTENQPYV